MDNLPNITEQDVTPVSSKPARKVIGRVLTAPSRNLDSRPISEEVTFTLRSGKQATFKRVHFSSEELKNDTYVETVINGREQDALTEEGVANIRRTLKLQQFQLCIGRKIGDKTEWLDGSRRRFCAILDNLGLDALVTEDEISIDDAKGLANDIQTAKEHNLREMGLPLLELSNNGMSQRDIAKGCEMSQATVGKAIQAAKVPSAMLTVFPLRDELNYPDYKLLYNISVNFEKKDVDIDVLISSVTEEALLLDKSMAAENFKDEVLSLYRKLSNRHLEKPEPVANEKPEVTQLIQFKDSSMYARKQVKGRNLSFNFSRLSKEAQNDIEAAILKTLQKHYSS